MDRQIIFIVSAAIIGLTAFGGLYLSPSASTADQPRTTFSPDDIRYKYQQDAAKEAAKNKNKPKAQASSSSTTSDEFSDESTDENPAEEPTAEEPSIE